ncbi:hypothetical protein CDG81_12340 [Actinopolyspora erythraea]|uniref:DUF4158 domain-containing protein n=1 Tax=Actinopolyspora erythraea TaxID=414996 RepID=A0A223RSU5_9ACTN|nr:hypothetical protein CDG81_12340 [Actinopolyspora erythraea]
MGGHHRAASSQRRSTTTHRRPPRQPRTPPTHTEQPRKHLQLGLAPQLGTVRCSGTFLADPLEVPTTVVDLLAGQLKIAEPPCAKSSGQRHDHTGPRTPTPCRVRRRSATPRANVGRPATRAGP